MAKMIGNIGSDGKTVTLTTGSLSSWITTGGQVWSQHITGSNTIASITSSTVFVLGTAVSGAPYTGDNITIAQPWSAAQAQWYYNVPNPPLTASVSTAAGYLGSDGGSSIAINGGNSIWMFDDMYWATAASQTRSQGASIHNGIALQTGNDLSTNGCMSFYQVSNSSPEEFFPPSNGLHYWPQGGIYLNSGCLLISALIAQYGWSTLISAQVINPRQIVFWVNNPTASMSSWNFQIVNTPFGEGIPGWGTSNWLNPGDGYVYMSGVPSTLNPSIGPTNRNSYMIRFPLADLNTGTPSFARPQWWCGTPIGWAGTDMHNPDLPILQSIHPIFSSTSAFDVFPDGNNGIYQHTATSDYVYLDNLTAGSDSGLYYSGLSSLSTPSLSNTRLFYQPAENSGNNLYIYGTKAHIEQTWSGKGTDDVLVTYNTNLNSGDPGVDMTSYWTQFLRVSGL